MDRFHFLASTGGIRKLDCEELIDLLEAFAQEASPWVRNKIKREKPFDPKKRISAFEPGTGEGSEHFYSMLKGILGGSITPDNVDGKLVLRVVRAHLWDERE